MRLFGILQAFFGGFMAFLSIAIGANVLKELEYYGSVDSGTARSAIVLFVLGIIALYRGIKKVAAAKQDSRAESVKKSSEFTNYKEIDHSGESAHPRCEEERRASDYEYDGYREIQHPNESYKAHCEEEKLAGSYEYSDGESYTVGTKRGRRVFRWVILLLWPLTAVVWKFVCVPRIEEEYVALTMSTAVYVFCAAMFLIGLLVLYRSYFPTVTADSGILILRRGLNNREEILVSEITDRRPVGARIVYYRKNESLFSIHTGMNNALRLDQQIRRSLSLRAMYESYMR